MIKMLIYENIKLPREHDLKKKKIRQIGSDYFHDKCSFFRIQ